jgi:maleate isomerase
MSDTIGFRRLFGLLVPYFNSVVQPELDGLRPDGISNQTARFSLDENVLDDIAQAAEKLATCGVHGFIVGLSTESFPGGLALLEQGVEEIKRRTNLPVTTASHAVHAALRVFGVKRIAVVTPFDAAANEHVRDAFGEHGFEVVAIDGLACPDFATIGHSTHDNIRTMFSKVDTAEAEALVQVGTGLPVLGLVEELEAKYLKPVITCNAASYWQALREAGIDDHLSNRGRLFSEH